jgi:hypothetical protein
VGQHVTTQRNRGRPVIGQLNKELPVGGARHFVNRQRRAERGNFGNARLQLRHNNKVGVADATIQSMNSQNVLARGEATQER